MPQRPVTLSDLTDDLLWTKLLRAPALALAPSRMAIAFFGVVLLALVTRLPDLWLGGGKFGTLASDAFSRIAGDRPLGDAGLWMGIRRVAAGVYGTPDRLLADATISTLVVALLSAVVVGVFGGAIGRSAAVDFTAGVRLSTSDALKFSARRWTSMASVLLIPLVIVLVLRLVLAAIGWATVSLPWINVIAALFFPLAIAVGIGAMVIIIGYAAAFPMLTAAVACEASDAIDALQRVYAYFIARPLRLLLYWVLLGGLILFAGVFFRVIFSDGALFAGESVSRWLSQRPAAVVTGFIPDSLHSALQSEPPRAHERAAHAVFGFWWNIPLVLLASWAFSVLHTGGTILYLLMRKACDGQELAEINLK
jgi:hypothetical protein